MNQNNFSLATCERDFIKTRNIVQVVMSTGIRQFLYQENVSYSALLDF